MKFLKSKIIIFLMATYLFNTNLLGLEKLEIYTENYPPYNMEQNGTLTGLSVDIFDEMLKRVESNQTKEDILLRPWSRGYLLAKKNKNGVIFSTTRTEDRENIFKWVGPITKTQIGLLALKEKNIKKYKIDDIKKYKIGAVLEDVGEQLLLKIDNEILKEKIQSISGNNAVELSFKKMKNGRIDLFAYELNVAKYIAKLNGYDLNKYEVVHTLKDGELYYAFNLNTSDEVIQQLQKALDEIKADGTYKNIIKNY